MARGANLMVVEELVARILDAHGGLSRWQAVTELTVRLSLSGPFWELRGWPNVYADQTVTLDPHHEHITFAPFTAPDRFSVLDVEPERVAIRTLDGELVEERFGPRASFPLPFDDFNTQWDALQLAYFTSAAVWTHLTEPFVFALPGVLAVEIDPWHEDGDTWRRLAVTFPATIAIPDVKQVFYYDETFLQRRVDYSPDATGNPPLAQYTHDHKTFDGFVFPTRRLVHLRDADGHADETFSRISVDVETVGVSTE